MKTRMEFWRKYRNEINNNIKLQEAVEISNEKLTLLNKRLLKVFPNYNEKYKLNIKKNVKSFFEEIDKMPHFSLTNIDKLLSEINEKTKFSETFNSINDMDFSSHEIDNIIKRIKERNSFSKYQSFEMSKMGIVMEKPIIKNINNRKIQIAIDGPSGSGKSTIAKLIAKKYNLKYLNTGLVYRTIALNAIEKNVNINIEEEVVSTLENGMIELLENERVILKGIDVTSQLRKNEVSQASSKVSVHNNVRKWAKLIQKKYSLENKIIMDGRDTTFNIMPHANIKIFLETSARERANRRTIEIIEKGLKVNFKDILKETEERDYRDKNRKVDPLHKVKDAYLINATKLSIKDVINKISKIIDKDLFDE